MNERIVTLLFAMGVGFLACLYVAELAAFVEARTVSPAVVIFTGDYWFASISIAVSLIVGCFTTLASLRIFNRWVDAD